MTIHLLGACASRPPPLVWIPSVLGHDQPVTLSQRVAIDESPCELGARAVIGSFHASRGFASDEASEALRGRVDPAPTITAPPAGGIAVRAVTLRVLLRLSVGPHLQTTYIANGTFNDTRSDREARIDAAIAQGTNLVMVAATDEASALFLPRFAYRTRVMARLHLGVMAAQGEAVGASGNDVATRCTGVGQEGAP